MSLEFILQNLLTPPILFFALGMLAVLLKSDLEIPQPFPKILSLYLLFAIGFKGGVELSHSGIDMKVFLTLGSAILLSVIVPVYTFFILRMKLSVSNAAAIAATYGSISAVTFITGASFLNANEVSYGGYMIAAMALMESPAIIIGVLLKKLNSKTDDDQENGTDWGELLRDSFFNGSVFLLTGSLVIGIITGDEGWKTVEPLAGDLFKGVLCLFLLDMGIVATRRIGVIKKAGGFILGFSVLIPLVNAAFSILIGYALKLGVGDVFMLTLLGASASYIAVPAAMRLAVPKADPSYYVTMALGLTFPFNIVIGIPLYYGVIQWIWG